MSELGHDLGARLAFLNACLNGSSALCLLIGYCSIRMKRRMQHRNFMVAAFVFSIFFLISYVTRFSLTGVHHYQGTGMIRSFYFLLLGSHTILAVITPFLAIRTLALALKGRFGDHQRWARVTFPIWMYVSITGVIVYILLYHPSM